MATGKGAHFTLDDPTSPEDISAWIRAITPANDAEEVDATVITSTKREVEPTFERDRLTIRLKAHADSLTFARAVKGQTDLDYIYGPFGSGVGKARITGKCNVLRAQSIPGADPGTLTEIELELNINTEVHDVFA